MRVGIAGGIVLVLVLAAIVLGYSSLFTVYQTQQALVAETNFRRAMENSMLTGMRVLDLEGRITYVNAAFCAMTGWSEADLVGKKPPFPYWLESEREVMNERLEEAIHGRALPGGVQVKVRRKNGTIFNARLYVSPLIDARGQQAGWMTSMTDITEPTRIREQLSAYVDHGRMPRIAAIEDDAEARALVESMERLGGLARTMADEDADAAGPGEDQWLDNLLGIIRSEVRAGRDLTIEDTDERTSTTITEGALREVARQQQKSRVVS